MIPLGCFGCDLQAAADLRGKILAATEGCARTTIVGGDGSPYLHRYTLAAQDDAHLYLHGFVRGDEDRELHDHPWSGRSLILLGGYREERRFGNFIATREFRRGDVNTIEPDTFHRIDLLGPECWTLFRTGPTVKSWGFWSRSTDVFTPWREFIAAKGLVPRG